jgi:hypothetical protein
MPALLSQQKNAGLLPRDQRDVASEGEAGGQLLVKLLKFSSAGCNGLPIIVLQGQFKGPGEESACLFVPGRYTA